MPLRLEITEQLVGLRTPLKTSWGVLDRRRLFQIVLTGDDGVAGRGEAAPLEAFDGVSDDACRAGLQALRAALLHADDAMPGHLLLDRLAPVTAIAPAMAALDLAMWDRAGRRAGKPVAQLISEDALSSIAVHATIGGSDPATAAAQAAAAAAAGFTAFKIKVGLAAADGSGPDLAGDLARVAAVREAVGPAACLKVDANGAWDVAQAIEALRALCARPLCVAAAEEPVSGSEQWPHLRAAVNADQLPVELSIDETADREPGAIGRGADVVELKLARSGGIGPLLVRAALVELAGASSAISSTFDGPLGIAAAIHTAAALRIERPLGLATLSALNLDDAPELAALAAGLEPVAGRIAVPTGPGLL